MRAWGVEPVGTVRVGPAELRCVSVGKAEVPGLIDELPMIAALGARAHGVTSIYGAEELRAKEKEIFHAEENALAREQTLFASLVAAVLDESIALAQTADALAELDVLAGWAVLAREWDYARPELDESDVLEIVEGKNEPEACTAEGVDDGFLYSEPKMVICGKSRA